jgi:hypothetical protein
MHTRTARRCVTKIAEQKVKKNKIAEQNTIPSPVGKKEMRRERKRSEKENKKTKAFPHSLHLNSAPSQGCLSLPLLLPISLSLLPSV